jgi:hypothetical protein
MMVQTKILSRTMVGVAALSCTYAALVGLTASRASAETTITPGRDYKLCDVVTPQQQAAGKVANCRTVRTDDTVITTPDKTAPKKKPSQPKGPPPAGVKQ